MIKIILSSKKTSLIFLILFIPFNGFASNWTLPDLIHTSGPYGNFMASGCWWAKSGPDIAPKEKQLICGPHALRIAKWTWSGSNPNYNCKITPFPGYKLTGGCPTAIKLEKAPPFNALPDNLFKTGPWGNYKAPGCGWYKKDFHSTFNIPEKEKHFLCGTSLERIAKWVWSGTNEYYNCTINPFPGYDLAGGCPTAIMLNREGTLPTPNAPPKISHWEVGSEAYLTNTFIYDDDLRPRNPDGSLPDNNDPNARHNGYTPKKSKLIIEFKVSDDKTDNEDLTFKLKSTNTGLVRNGTLSPKFDGDRVEISIAPQGMQVGSTSLTLEVSDGSKTSIKSFDLNVLNPKKSLLVNGDWYTLRETRDADEKEHFGFRKVLETLAGQVREEGFNGTKDAFTKEAGAKILLEGMWQGIYRDTIYTRLTNIDDYKPIALINRFDERDEVNFSHCGTYRMEFALAAEGDADEKSTGHPNDMMHFMIFEGQIPNPIYGSEAGCLEIAKFWAELSSMENPDDLAQRLDDFFFNGLPGHKPAIHVENFSESTGQIRTHTQRFGTDLSAVFREFAFKATSPNSVRIRTKALDGSVDLSLYTETVDGDPDGLTPFQSQFIAEIASLAKPFGEYHLNVDEKYYSQEQEQLPSDVSNFYSELISPAFKKKLEEKELKTLNFAQAQPFISYRDYDGPGVETLSAEQIINRAVTTSCTGCHQSSRLGLNTDGNSLGGGMTFSSHEFPDFVADYTDARVNPGAPDRGKEGDFYVYILRTGMVNEFIPYRAYKLDNYLNKFQ